MQLVTPVHADVGTRALLKMLPVNDLFKYCTPDEPDRRLCPHDCGTNETIAHTLHDCPAISPVWLAHAPPWQQYGVAFSWHNTSNLDAFSVNAKGRHMKNLLFKLWVMLTGVTIHLAWLQRNHKKHRRRAAPPHHVLVDQSFVAWMSTIRWWLRRQEHDDPIISQAKTLLESLLSKHPYSELRSKYPKCLALETTFDVH
ncbi:hypothetical protein AC1031_022026 [Aphanomyces cochlioides]|nr:hypothetical protein AC1031_022026 [Aphanomyces cochlioides]